LNFQLRKITKNRGHFTSEDAAMKLLYRWFVGSRLTGVLLGFPGERGR
jgi:hypothetical protein